MNTTSLIIRNVLIMLSILLILQLIASTSYRFGKLDGDLECDAMMLKMLEKNIPSSVQEVNCPTDSELFERFIQCRQDLTELAEATNMNIVCHDRTCSR